MSSARPVFHRPLAGEIERLSAIWLFTDLLESVALSTNTLLSRSESFTGAFWTDTALDGVAVHLAGAGRFHDEGRRSLTRRSGGELHLAQ